MKETKCNKRGKRKERLVQNNILGKTNDWAIVLYLPQKNKVVKNLQHELFGQFYGEKNEMGRWVVSLIS